MEKRKEASTQRSEAAWKRAGDFLTVIVKITYFKGFCFLPQPIVAFEWNEIKSIWWLIGCVFQGFLLEFPLMSGNNLEAWPVHIYRVKHVWVASANVSRKLSCQVHDLLPGNLRTQTLTAQEALFWWGFMGILRTHLRTLWAGIHSQSKVEDRDNFPENLWNNPMALITPNYWTF